MCSGLLLASIIKIKQATIPLGVKILSNSLMKLSLVSRGARPGCVRFSFPDALLELPSAGSVQRPLVACGTSAHCTHGGFQRGERLLAGPGRPPTAGLIAVGLDATVEFRWPLFCPSPLCLILVLKTASPLAL